MSVEDWFLDLDERGNPDTMIDRRRADGSAFTEGNAVEVLIDGRSYFERLHETLVALSPGDWVHFTDWRGDPDEQLTDEPESMLARLLAGLAQRGVHVRGLVWRSHSDRAHFSEEENLHLVETVNEAGGEVLLDERVRRDGSHHQKLFVARHPDEPDRDVAFVGGIDLCHGRRDDDQHAGDPQTVDIDSRYGPRPAWHDVQLQVRGPAVGDLAWTFRERWEDPTPLDHRNPWRAALRRVAREPRHPDPLPPPPPDPSACGLHAVQVLRTYPCKRPAMPFAAEGERSIARAYVKVFGRARRLVYIEDQYLWSGAAAGALARRLEEVPDLHLVAVVPRYPDQDGRISGPPYRIGQQRAIEMLRDAGGDRVSIFDLEGRSGWPIYVHAKVCIIDDVWMAVGSDNLNIRSWTNDSELSCAVIDDERDPREPRDPGGLGEGARVLARATRLRLWREHLGREPGGRGAHDAPADEEATGGGYVDDLLDVERGVGVLRSAAAELSAWSTGDQTGPRPPGRLREHRPGPVRWWAAWWAEPLQRTLVDPDGRPRGLRRSGRF